MEGYRENYIIRGAMNRGEQSWSSFKAHEYGNIENASFHCGVFEANSAECADAIKAYQLLYTLL
jgi:hypothetical protein